MSDLNQLLGRNDFTGILRQVDQQPVFSCRQLNNLFTEPYTMLSQVDFQLSTIYYNGSSNSDNADRRGGALAQSLTRFKIPRTVASKSAP